MLDQHPDVFEVFDSLWWTTITQHKILTVLNAYIFVRPINMIAPHDRPSLTRKSLFDSQIVTAGKNDSMIRSHVSFKPMNKLTVNLPPPKTCQTSRKHWQGWGRPSCSSCKTSSPDLTNPHKTKGSVHYTRWQMVSLVLLHALRFAGCPCDLPSTHDAGTGWVHRPFHCCVSRKHGDLVPVMGIARTSPCDNDREH
ncbi:hypothetical protein PR048_013474 [Dryococelus australis]|uniref:Uncharacterized protein n=1 Tax=Dryococelus australis TaxID=614101 RepID=A0ABQ9HT42_9NEOP|nr:hypothetical protein PR048_013474 [Dryococelus australis]